MKGLYKWNRGRYVKKMNKIKKMGNMGNIGKRKNSKKFNNKK